MPRGLAKAASATASQPFLKTGHQRCLTAQLLVKPNIKTLRQRSPLAKPIARKRSEECVKCCCIRPFGSLQLQSHRSPSSPRFLNSENVTEESRQYKEFVGWNATRAGTRWPEQTSKSVLQPNSARVKARAHAYSEKPHAVPHTAPS